MWTPRNIDPIQALWYFVFKKFIKENRESQKKAQHNLLFFVQKFPYRTVDL